MKKTIYTVLLLLVVCSGLSAQIVYHDINPDTTVSTWDGFVIQPTSNAANDLVIWYHPNPEVVVQTHGSCEILFDAGGVLPSKLNQGTTINATGVWQTGAYDPLNSSGNGNWQANANDKYLAFRFLESGVWNYGWLKLSVTASPMSFTVKEWAYRAQGGAILAGQKNATSIASAPGVPEIGMICTGRMLRFTHLPDSKSYPVRVTDMNGRPVLVSGMAGGKELDLRQLPAGMYQVALYMGPASRYFKLEIF